MLFEIVLKLHRNEVNSAFQRSTRESTGNEGSASTKSAPANHDDAECEEIVGMTEIRLGERVRFTASDAIFIVHVSDYHSTSMN